jgi:hypothetical protein
MSMLALQPHNSEVNTDVSEEHTVPFFIPKIGSIFFFRKAGA